MTEPSVTEIKPKKEALVGTSKPASSTRRMTPAQWSEAKALWESGEFTLAQIAKRVKATREHLSRKFKKEGIEKGASSVKVSESAAAAVEDEIAKNARIIPMRIAETKEEHYVWAQTTGKLSMQLLSRAIREGKPISSISEDAKAIERIANIMTKVMDQRYRALGIDKDDYIDEETLPTLSIDIMTEDQMNEVRTRAREQTLGVDDGLGGTLTTDEIVEYDEDDLELGYDDGDNDDVIEEGDEEGDE